MKSGFIAIVGRPNVGKSTLLNRLVGQKLAIVSPKPQTTRNGILAVAHRDGAQFVFYDTPGIHKPANELDRHMLQTVVQTLKRADLALLIVDVGDPMSAGDRRALDIVKKTRVPIVVGINKIDTGSKSQILPIIAGYSEQHELAAIVPFSALTGENVDRLEGVLREHLPEGEALFPEETVTELPERFFVAEIVREKILRLTQEEVPHQSAVSIELWEEGEALTRIEASILVSRPSQKGILIGKNGDMLKKIGTSARKDIEQFLGTHVYLGLHVKVESDWRDNRRVLGELGL